MIEENNQGIQSLKGRCHNNLLWLLGFLPSIYHVWHQLLHSVYLFPDNIPFDLVAIFLISREFPACEGGGESRFLCLPDL
jgi:hypothetical protein